MNQPKLFPKVSFDLFWVQLTWTFWALGIFLVINLGKIILSEHVDTFYAASYVGANIYMLVIGIISIAFLTYYVENGVTRKDYFLGNVVASLGLSIVLPILAYLISLIEKLILNFFTHIVLTDPKLDEIAIDIDGNIIGEILLSFLLTPFINPESNILLSLGLFSLHLFVFYLVGWLIGAAFYRLNVVFGILFIAIAIGIIAFKDSMIRLMLDIPLFESFSTLDFVPKGFAPALVVVTILITIILIRQLTKRAAIKM
ncbi:hypothetical protein [Oceanobacillus bengalensis]|uniref:Uncharacterized protein n=1 Tax=Oceanobacillus bengalensis TaxID=1435466 RepID=A0A494YT67_9BACI|nr:hypothetical protein [Oceanobacillus bengalensis]RKQ13317.1 hypothetical protein D8M05_16725 [Oceanobacillus bengalensis]